MDDEYNFRGDVEADSIYDGGADSSQSFKRYLRAVERKKGYLPDWWSKEKADECVRSGLAGGREADLRTAAEKSDISGHYGSSFMPMQLRMFAEEVLGSPLTPGGGGAMMRQMQMMRESGGADGLNMSHLNLGR